jgi:hypothetical protein
MLAMALPRGPARFSGVGVHVPRRSDSAAAAAPSFEEI